MTPDAASHWSEAYGGGDAARVSWHQDEPVESLELVAEAGLAPQAAIIDVGSGASRLALRLAHDGYRDVTAFDISPAALAIARSEAGDDADKIKWVTGDVRRHDFGRTFDAWHDRAVFHFMVSPEDRDAYLANLRRSLRPGGQLLLATFGPAGPTRCSGLPTARYDAAALARLLGDEFARRSARVVRHRTPAGGTQQFLVSRWQRRH